MNKSDLKLFARQLSVWAELVIDHGRTPFRRVDLFPRLNTRIGTLHPPLVFWINRQSLMAGGVILLPDNDLQLQLEQGCAVSEALGLRHFVTWEQDCVRIWDTSEAPPREEKLFTVASGNDPEVFRSLLLEVMEQLKLLSVLSMVPTSELSPSYLHNLFQETLDSALGPLVTAFRQTRAEGGLLEATRADRQADQLNQLTLLRLLALLWHDRLPESILPEKLERAIELALPALPQELQQSLSFTAGKQEPPLPNDSAVCFHHLLLRLRQIRWNAPPERAVQAINQMLSAKEGVIKPPFTAIGSNTPLLQINPDSPLLGHEGLHELSDSPAFLAAAALLRHINQLPPSQQHHGSVFTFTTPSLSADQIQGKLTNRRKVSREERQRFDGLLRASWPTRRFKLPADTPYWAMETIHLLGLSPTDAFLQLEIPASWLTTTFGKTLWELIMDSFHLQTISLGEGTTILQLQKQKSESVLTTVRRMEEECKIDWSEHPKANRSQILYGLLLTAEQYRLIYSDRFQYCSETSSSTVTDAGLLSYSKSSLGQCLWEILGIGKMPQTAAELRQQKEGLDWPVPDDEVLCKLGLQKIDGLEKTLPQEKLDRRLADLVESSVPVAMTCPQLPQLSGSAISSRQSAPGNHREAILHHLDACGVPNFPGQYLYQLENPLLTSYHFQPPLQITSELLGQFELTDASGKSFPVSGDITVDALNLCAAQGRTEVELPADPQQLNDILDAYRNDLNQLRQELARQTHTHLENPQAAERLAKKLWKELNLPAWKWLDH